MFVKMHHVSVYFWPYLSVFSASNACSLSVLVLLLVYTKLAWSFYLSNPAFVCFNYVHYDYQMGRNVRPYTTRNSFSWCIKNIVSVVNISVKMQIESLQVLNCLMFGFPDNSLQIACEEVSYASVNGSLEQTPNYILHVYPLAILHNYLPYNICYATKVSTVNVSFRSSFRRKTPL